MSEPNWLSATEIARRTRSGALSVEAVARACLDRIAARDEAVRAWAFLDPDRVIAEARRLDAAPARGPLHGVPVGVKDMILTADMPTQHNSPIHAGDFPRLDAAPVMSLRAAGALLLGKTVTTEFAATVAGGKTRNPHDPARTPGGSSSGSAAAVADGQAAVALGTQTGGSTIRPASFNGVPALKPTWGVISREGLKMLSLSNDTLGLYARSMADLALLADVFGMPGAAPEGRFALAGARIALCRSPAWPQAEPATRAALEKGAALLADAGAAISELVLPDEFDALLHHHRVVMGHEAGSAFRNDYLMHHDLLRDEFRAHVENRAGRTVEDLRRAYDAGARGRAAFDAIAAGFDAVLTPSATGEAPQGLESTGNPVFNSMWTFLHVPVVNVPGFVGPNGMPVGLSLVGARFADHALLRVAATVAEVFAGGG